MSRPYCSNALRYLRRIEIVDRHVQRISELDPLCPHPDENEMVTDQAENDRLEDGRDAEQTGLLCGYR